MTFNFMNCKGPVTPSCVPMACLRRCKIHGIAVGSQGKLKKNVQFISTCFVPLTVFTFYCNIVFMYLNDIETALGEL